MKVWAGCYVEGDDPTNLPTMFIAGSEKELVVLLADEARGNLSEARNCETLDELSDFLSEDEEAESDYEGITWETKEL